MILVVKGWSTETGISVASLGLQIHGGMGYIEETGAAQHLRDARITTIYEGTMGIQALDLVGRKVARDGGASVGNVIEQMREVQGQLGRCGDQRRAVLGMSLRDAVAALDQAARYIVAEYGNQARKVAVGAVPILELFGIVAGGWQMARAAPISHQRLSEGGGDAAFYRAKLETAFLVSPRAPLRPRRLGRCPSGTKR